MFDSSQIRSIVHWGRNIWEGVIWGTVANLILDTLKFKILGDLNRCF